MTGRHSDWVHEHNEDCNEIDRIEPGTWHDYVGQLILLGLEFREATDGGVHVRDLDNVEALAMEIIATVAAARGTALRVVK